MISLTFFSKFTSKIQDVTLFLLKTKKIVKKSIFFSRASLILSINV